MKDPAPGTDLFRIFETIRGRRGAVLNLYRVIANQPAALEAFLEMSHYVRDRSSLSTLFRELLILVVANRLNEPYELHQHQPLALEAGASPEVLQAIMQGDFAKFPARERAALQLVEALTDGKDADPAMRDALVHFLPGELVDVVLTAGWYQLCAVVIRAFRIEPEGGGAQ